MRGGAAAVVLTCAATFVVAALTGCAARSVAGSLPAATPPAAPISLSTAVSAAGASWAVVQTGGPSVGGRSWQLLVRPAGGSNWRLVTPPGVADSAGLVLAPAADGTMTVGFVPGQRLTFTPLAITKDDGAHWSQGLFPAGLLAAPSALAALPGGRLLAITARGAEESAPGADHWTSLVTLRALASTPAGRTCGLTALTAAAASPSGDPLLAGDCSRPGTVGVFDRSADGWHAMGMVLHGAEAKQPVRVLQLLSAGVGTNVLLAVGSGRDLEMIPAWLAATATALVTGAPLLIKGSPATSTFFPAKGGWGVVFKGKRAQYAVPVPSAHAWFNSALTPMPASPATVVLGSGLAPGQGALLTALVPGADTVSVWEQTRTDRWRRTNVITISAAPS